MKEVSQHSSVRSGKENDAQGNRHREAIEAQKQTARVVEGCNSAVVKLAMSFVFKEVSGFESP